ncbi:MAG: hypothetical protein KC431_29930, partial [Myxococcales bacterium]|nr:hypothetical protein [Myxococcales bacterium]
MPTLTKTLNKLGPLVVALILPSLLTGCPGKEGEDDDIGDTGDETAESGTDTGDATESGTDQGTDTAGSTDTSDSTDGTDTANSTDTGDTTDTGEPIWPTVDLEALPYETLSEYGFFLGELQELNPAAGVHPYTVVSPLFSDFAGKDRFMYLPEGSTLHVDWQAASPGPGGEGELWDWPMGSVLIKNFYFDLDRSNPGQEENAKLVETRLLVRFPDGWEVYTYLWDDEETEAVLTKFGKLVEIAFTDEQGQPATQEYKVPSLEQCGSCHARDNVLYTLGPVSLQMNYDVVRDGQTINQMQWLADRGLFDEALPDLSDYPTLVNPMGGSGTLDQKARSYLHANCSHC